MSSIRTISKIFLSFFVIILFSNCKGDSNIFRVDYSLAEEMLFDVTGISPTTSSTGLITYTVESGEGPFQVTIRDEIYLYITVRTKEDNRVVDSSYANGIISPRYYNQNSTSTNYLPGLIDGVIEGILGMKEGEKKVIVVPPSLAYGESEGHPLETDTLIVDLELETILY